MRLNRKKRKVKGKTWNITQKQTVKPNLKSMAYMLLKKLSVVRSCANTLLAERRTAVPQPQTSSMACGPAPSSPPLLSFS